jgi:hypothetical protein
MKTLSSIAVLLFTVVLCNAQRGSISAYHDVLLNETSNITTNPFGLTDAQLAATIGSPYDLESFVRGNIYVKDKLAKKDVFIRFNVLQGTIEVKDSERAQNHWPLSRQEDVFVKTILNDIFVFVPNNALASDGGYFQILSGGETVDLYKKTDIRYVDAYEAKTSMETSRPAKFVKTDVYFAVNKRGDFIELPSRSKKLTDVLSMNSDRVNKYIKKNKIKADDEADLKKLFAYYNAQFKSK